VLKIQHMLHLCTDHLDPEKQNDLYQAFAVLGISVIAMGEDIGTEMAYRSFNHLMHYGEAVIRRTVPLALGLLCVSKPLELQIVDTLSKYSHDNDLDVARSAVFALGLVGAGTNNARLAQMLRQLAQYYQKEADTLFVVRIAQVNRKTTGPYVQCCLFICSSVHLFLYAGSAPLGKRHRHTQPVPLQQEPAVARSPRWPARLGVFHDGRQDDD